MWFIEERPKLNLPPRPEKKYRRWRGRLMNSGAFRTGSNRVYKRVHVSREALGRVLRRLESIRLRPPERVPRLFSYRLRGESIELRMEEIHGQTLCEFVRANAIATLRGQFDQTLSQWRAQCFIHGDLSPANILIAVSSGITRPETRPETRPKVRPEVWFVDWVTDLEGFEGTPRYACPETFAGRRAHASDAYAVSKIFKDYDRGFRSMNPLVLLRNAAADGKHLGRGFKLGRSPRPEKKTRGDLCSLVRAHPRCAPFLF